MTEMQTSVLDFNAYDAIQLEEEQSDELFRFITLSIFRHPARKRSANPSGSDQPGAGRYLYSQYQHIMPQNLESPLASRRIRAFIPGYNAKEAKGFKSDDHIVGGVQVYRSSRPHFMFEIGYLRPKKRPTRHFFEFIHHQNLLMTTQQCADTDQLFMEESDPEETISDVMSFKYWLEELSEARNKKNGFKEGMRKRGIPGGMSFAWPLLRNSVQLSPVKVRYDDDLPFDSDTSEVGTLAGQVLKY